jgi:hypothetical protein
VTLTTHRLPSSTTAEITKTKKEKKKKEKSHKPRANASTNDGFQLKQGPKICSANFARCLDSSLCPTEANLHFKKAIYIFFFLRPSLTLFVSLGFSSK